MRNKNKKSSVATTNDRNRRNVEKNSAENAEKRRCGDHIWCFDSGVQCISADKLKYGIFYT